MSTSCIIVEDEPIALEALRDMVRNVSWLDCIGEAMDGATAIRLIDELEPDLVLLDIELPAGSGLQVLEEIRHQPAVIFTTAYDRYAVTAFELGAIDYLLKPFREERFRAAIERAAQALDSSRAREVLAPGPLQRVFVRQQDRIIQIAVPTIERFEAEGDYVALYTRGARYLINVSMTDLAQRLEPTRFYRVHRSHIVNLDYVSAIIPLGTARLEIEMKDGSRVTASRSGARALRDLVL